MCVNFTWRSVHWDLVRNSLPFSCFFWDQCCGSRMFIPALGSAFFHRGSQMLDLDFPSRIRGSTTLVDKEWKYFSQKTTSKLSDIWFEMFIQIQSLGSRIRIFLHLVSRIRIQDQGAEKHWIPDPDRNTAWDLQLSFRKNNLGFYMLRAVLHVGSF
jgi:hypothetical protein